ncbi:MAG: hypothetical protein SO169_05510 [Parabacteroides sp.]|nr:hypothetical protein [Parabacteroides sp.]
MTKLELQEYLLCDYLQKDTYRECLHIPADIRSLCWNTTDSNSEEKGEEKKNVTDNVTNYVTDKETGGQTGGQRRTKSSEMNVASSEKSSGTCGFGSERTIKSSGTGSIM